MADIFVSYTSSDLEWAEWIGHEIETLGHTPHLHDWEISGGGDLAAWMEKRHNDADHVLCVVSKTYLDKPYSAWERRAAQWAATSNRPNFVLPVFIEDCEPPTLFAHLKRCELFEIELDVARQRLKTFLTPAQKPASPPSFPRPNPGALSNIPIRVPQLFMPNSSLLFELEHKILGTTESDINNKNEYALKSPLKEGIFEETKSTMQTEFRNSKLDTCRHQQVAIRSSIAQLHRVGIAKSNILPNNNIFPIIAPPSYHGRALKEILKLSSTLQSITIQCLNIFPASIATLKHMKSLGFNIELFHGYYIGRDMVSKLGAYNVKPYDFLITGEPGTYFSSSMEVLKYHQVLCITHLTQRAYERIGSKSKRKRLLYSARTSAEEQFISGVEMEGMPEEVDSTLLSRLDDGECILRWEPFPLKGLFQPISQTEYEFRIAMFAEEGWVSDKRKLDLDVFLNAFIASWNYLKRYQHIAIKLLEDDWEYQIDFAMGLVWILEVNNKIVDF